MLLGTFREKIRKCNSRIYIDTDREMCPFGYTEYPVGGMYIREPNGEIKYLMGVPHIDVPEYSIAAVDFNKLVKGDRFEDIKEIERTGLALDKERLIWRGWRAIVGNLIRMQYITKDKAQRVFNTYFEPDRIQLPRNYINKPL